MCICKTESSNGSVVKAMDSNPGDPRSIFAETCISVVRKGIRQESTAPAGVGGRNDFKRCNFIGINLHVVARCC